MFTSKQEFSLLEAEAAREVETAKINGVDLELYLKLAALDSLAGRPIPLPHQLG